MQGNVKGSNTPPTTAPPLSTLDSVKQDFPKAIGSLVSLDSEVIAKDGSEFSAEENSKIPVQDQKNDVKRGEAELNIESKEKDENKEKKKLSTPGEKNYPFSPLLRCRLPEYLKR